MTFRRRAPKTTLELLRHFALQGTAKFEAPRQVLAIEQAKAMTALG
jgi:hypothetical protein